MARSGRSTVPWFTADVEPTPEGGREAAGRLDGFAARHHVGARARCGIAAIAIDVVDALSSEQATGSPVTVEADIDQGNVQVVITQEHGSSTSLDAAVGRLRTIGEQSERFDVRRAGAAVEAWICLPVRADGQGE
jgi:hypothetical protein